MVAAPQRGVASQRAKTFANLCGQGGYVLFSKVSIIEICPKNHLPVHMIDRPIGLAFNQGL